LPKEAGDLAISRLDKFRNADGSRTTAQIRLEMQKVMQSDAAVFRTGSSLQEGCEKLAKTVDSFADVKTSDRGLIWNTDLIETLELDNLLGRSRRFNRRRTARRVVVRMPEKTSRIVTIPIGSSTHFAGWMRRARPPSTIVR
jgi:succinate dehydrogenase/fumarate reductase flavoprotein subunit